MKIIIIFLAIILTFTPISASSINDKKDQLNTTNQNIEDKKSQLANKEALKDSLEQEIKKVDLEIVAVQEEMSKLQNQLAEKKKELEVSEAHLEEANEKKDKQYDATKERMVQMYKNQKVNYLQVIFSADSFWEAINRLEYIRRISKKDNTILQEYEKQIQDIEEKKLKIEKEKNELDLLKKQTIVKESELETAKEKKNEAFKQLIEEEKKLKADILDLEKSSASIKAEIDRLTEEAHKKQNATSGGGKLPVTYEGGTFLWPVPGHYRISSDYSGRKSPISGKYEFHTGIDIPASYGKNVIAVADGVVITAGWVRGYGNTVMVSHGSGLVTLYAHNSSLVVSSGQKVKRGDTIAKIGSTGYSTGNHCHFEVRYNGNHVSPWSYLKK